MDGLDREDPRLPRLLLQQPRGSGLQGKAGPKERWLHLTGVEAEALVANGKYREGKPFWVRYYTDKEGKVKSHDSVYVKVDEEFKAWREKRVQEGKNSCQND